MGKEFYFETDDKLERKKYAEFLKTLLEHCDEYRREDSDGAYVIAIDSPWGTGKTRFAKMLKNKLECRAPKLENGEYDKAKIITDYRASSFNVIYYNSWETDYWNDALEPFLNSIMNSEVFDKIRKSTKHKQNWDQFVKFSKGVLEASVDAAAGFSIWGIIIKILIYGVKRAREKSIDPFEKYKERENLYSEYAISLNKVIAATGKKLIIIVDELDRCRPTYAIQTLELVKHLFKVENLAFIFALDIEQLSHAAGTIYGVNMDAPGYLCRFFDYITCLPAINVEKYIDQLLKTYIEHLNKTENPYSQSIRNEVIKLLTYLYENAQLSLRDLTTIINSYRILVAMFLNTYKDPHAHIFYISLLFLKYKHGDTYDLLTSEKEVNENLAEYLKGKLGFNVTRNIFEQIEQLNDKYLIRSKKHSIYIVDRLDRSDCRIKSVQIIDTEPNQINFELSIGTNVKDDIVVPYDESANFDRTLFFPDLKSWELVKMMTLSKYIKQQLEMFNFALPADGAPPEA